MRVVYVAGFFSHVLRDLEGKCAEHLESGSVVWIPSYGNSDEFNVNRFKGAFFGTIAGGATEVLICLFFMRHKAYLLETVQGIVAEGKTRSPNLKVQIDTFKNARDSAGVISKVLAFGPEPKNRLPQEAANHVPDTLDVLVEWVSERHAGRLILHPRAANAAKKSQYENISLIYYSIDLLGTEYWNMRTSTAEAADENRRLFEAKASHLGLEFSIAIAASRAGEQADEYEVSYPLGSGKKRLLELHLRKGTSRDERLCLRIYFFWDDDLKRVVIGWLPSHLETRDS